jgi:hypothetical protein
MVKSKVGRWIYRSLVGFLSLVGCAILAPQLMAFPFVSQIGNTTVYSEQPVNAVKMAQIIKRADMLTAQAGLPREPVGTRLFLTDGGVRWKIMSLTTSYAYALTRPANDFVSDSIMMNRSDVAKDRIFSGCDDCAIRTLSGVIAHEKTHMIMRRKLGFVKAVSLPQWKSEGFADHVAQESSLTAAQVAEFKSKGIDHGAIPYFEGRQRVAAILAANGNSVEKLFATDD